LGFGGEFLRVDCVKLSVLRGKKFLANGAKVIAKPARGFPLMATDYHRKAEMSKAAFRLTDRFFLTICVLRITCRYQRIP
jgi:hypothetical protein